MYLYTLHLICLLFSIFFFFFTIRCPPTFTLFPTRRSSDLPLVADLADDRAVVGAVHGEGPSGHPGGRLIRHGDGRDHHRSEEHTSELQSLTNLVCRLLLEKKKENKNKKNT